MAAYLERFGALTLMESDDGLTVHLDVADVLALGSHDSPLSAPGIDGARLADVVRCGMIERADGLNRVLDADERTIVDAWLAAYDPDTADCQTDTALIAEGVSGEDDPERERQTV